VKWRQAVTTAQEMLTIRNALSQHQCHRGSILPCTWHNVEFLTAQCVGLQYKGICSVSMETIFSLTTILTFLLHFPIELQHNLNYVYKCILCYIFYILLYIFKNTAFNHPPLFYISYSSRLVTVNITNLEF